MSLARVFAAITVATTAWGIAALVSRHSHVRQLGLGGRRYRIPAPPLEVSIQVAAERRKRLLAFLDEHSQPSVAAEFVEIPPTLEGSANWPYIRELDEYESFWNASRLALQLNRDHFLLLERVTDAIVCLGRTNQIGWEDFPHSIQLERTRANRSFPWRVLITADRPETITPHLASAGMQNWLGVAIDVIETARSKRNENPPEATPTPPSAPRSAPSAPAATAAFGRCIEGEDGLEGTVGGKLDDFVCPPFGVTCEHVLSGSCKSMYWPKTPNSAPSEFTTNFPDVAFIRLSSPCFQPDQGPGTTMLVGSQADVELAQEGRVKVKKNHSRQGGMVYFAVASGFRLGEHFYRGPHFLVAPWFVKRFGIVWPLRRRFSQPGDSGSWVIDPSTSQWLGMVVGGFQPPNNMTVAVCAEHLVDAFNRYHTSTNVHPSGSTAIVAQTFS